ncbi:MAG TPA: hypothetical protein PLU72_05810 [Candidatus Ozemobacteraceae bacterium]|nr:hypothetical protein [Candidatus Ozemobacteraceae bacterium]HQG29026.1 hypothetical protein [Candidatus Ozemobacteraceae bacterium]
MIPAIKGKIQKGLGEGQNTLREQMPLFRECFPEVGICHPGTINILLEQPLVVITPDFTTRPLPWHPAFRVVKGGETFQFVRVRLTVSGHAPVNAWIYRAQFSPYRENPFYVEIIAPKIGYVGTPDCTVEVLSGCHAGIVVIGDGQLGKTPDAGSGPN